MHVAQALDRTKGSASPILLLLIWEVVVRTGLIDGEFLPSPSEIVGAILSLSASELLPELAATLFRIGFGFAIATVFGVVLGTAMALSKAVNNFFYPLL